MVSIAEGLGMQDYHTLYDDAANATLKGNRPNPNQLLIDDDWTDPPKGKVHDKPVDATHTFVVKPKKPPKLRIVMADIDGTPMSGKAWKLTAPKAAKGTTKKDGLIEVPDFPFQGNDGALEVTWQTTKAKKPPKPAKDPEFKKPVYPRPIKASEFTEVAPTAPTAADDVMEFTLKIGGLPTFGDVSGVRARLHNLGFGTKRGSSDDDTKKFVSAYQRAYLNQKTPSGLWQDVKDDVHGKHDNP